MLVARACVRLFQRGEDLEAKPLLKRISTRVRALGVMGLGVVGLPLEPLFVEVGNELNGFGVYFRWEKVLQVGWSPIAQVLEGRSKNARSLECNRSASVGKELAGDAALLIRLPTSPTKTGRRKVSCTLSTLELARGRKPDTKKVSPPAPHQALRES